MIRAAFIGTGNIAGAHLAVLRGREDVAIAALCDIKEENLKRRRDEFGGKGYADFERMLDAEKPDAVWVCTPARVRRGPLLACARRGIPVFCEKPAALDAAEAAAIAAELAGLKAKAQMGYMYRSHPAVRRLRREMETDTIRAFTSFYGCPLAFTPGTRPWLFDKAAIGGPLVDQATHNLDLLRFLLGDAVEVQALSRNPLRGKGPSYDAEELIALSLAFACGAVGTHAHSWIADRWRNEIVLSGERRLYRLEPDDGVLTVEEGAEKRIFRQEQGAQYRFENEAFLAQVGSGNWVANPCDYADAAASLDLALACDRALSASGRTAVDPDGAASQRPSLL